MNLNKSRKYGFLHEDVRGGVEFELSMQHDEKTSGDTAKLETHTLLLLIEEIDMISSEISSDDLRSDFVHLHRLAIDVIDLKWSQRYDEMENSSQLLKSRIVGLIHSLKKIDLILAEVSSVPNNPESGESAQTLKSVKRL